MEEKERELVFCHLGVGKTGRGCGDVETLQPAFRPEKHLSRQDRLTRQQTPEALVRLCPAGLSGQTAQGPPPFMDGARLSLLCGQTQREIPRGREGDREDRREEREGKRASER